MENQFKIVDRRHRVTAKEAVNIGDRYYSVDDVNNTLQLINFDTYENSLRKNKEYSKGKIIFEVDGEEFSTEMIVPDYQFERIVSDLESREDVEIVLKEYKGAPEDYSIINEVESVIELS